MTDEPEGPGLGTTVPGLGTIVRGIGRWLKRAALATVVGLVVLATVGAWWDDQETKTAHRALVPPTGELLDVGGHRLHVHCLGEGRPGVLLVAGLGNTIETWARTQSALAEETRVCRYDRAGIGWSEPHPRPGTVKATLDDMAVLVDSLFAGPPVLVGHSVGGLYVRRLAHRDPGAVAGLVLVDPTPEGLDAMLPRGLGLLQAGLSLTSAGVASSGFPRWAYYRGHPGLSQDERLGRGLAHSGAHARAAWRELRALRSESGPFVAPPGALGATPVVVLSAGRAPSIPFVDPRSIADSVRAAHERILLDSERATHRTVEGADHYVHVDDPEAVLTAIRSILDTAR